MQRRVQTGLQTAANALRRVADGANMAGGWLLLLLALVIGYDVVGRKFFNTGSVVLQDLEWHLHGAAIMLGFGGAYFHDAHVRVDLLRDRLADRWKVRLEIGGILLFLIPYLVMLILFGVDYAHRAFATGEGSVGGGGLDHRWVIKAFLPLGLGLVVLSGLGVLLQCLDYLRGGPSRPALLASTDHGSHAGPVS